MDYGYYATEAASTATSATTIIFGIISLAVSIWIIYLIYSINKGIKEVNKKLLKETDVNVALFQALEAGNTELCKKILDEKAREDFYNGAINYYSSPNATYYQEVWDQLKKDLENKYTELYNLCDVAPLDFSRLGKIETYKTLLRNKM